MTISISGFTTALWNFIDETETDVLTVITQIKADVVVAESDINSALHWVASNVPAITADIQQVLAIAEEIGIASNPDVAVAITAANVAVTALNAFASASNSGQSNTQAVIAGYVAVKQAQAASSSASAAVAGTPVTPAVIASTAG
jgi:hypothetical protein